MSPKNPFFILELPPASTTADVERQGRKLLGLLEVGAARGATYTCPLGTFPRDATAVRDAMALLRDPARFAREAFLAGFLLIEDAPRDDGVDADAPLPEAFALAGYLGL